MSPISQCRDQRTNGLVTGLKRGQAAVISVRYLNNCSRSTSPSSRTCPDFAWNKPAGERNFVDRLVDAKLQLLQYLPSPRLCGDANFIRRVCIST